LPAAVAWVRRIAIASHASPGLGISVRTTTDTAAHGRSVRCARIRRTGGLTECHPRGRLEGSMRRTLPGVILGLALVVGATSAAAAGRSDSRYFERGLTADVSAGRCTEVSGTDRLRCQYLSIDAFSGQTGGTDPSMRFRGTRVSIYISTEVFRPGQGRPIRSVEEFGFAANSDALQLTFEASHVSVTAPAASRSVPLKDHLPDAFVRALLNDPLMLPSKSVIVPSSLRLVIGPKDAPNFRFLLTARSL
jgi:hypothetical protein